jgi:hypothetical protein
MAKIPSSKFPTAKRKIPSRPFPKTNRKLASRPFPKTESKLASRPFATGTKVKKIAHPATKRESQGRLVTLAKTISTLKAARLAINPPHETKKPR